MQGPAVYIPNPSYTINLVTREPVPVEERDVVHYGNLWGTVEEIQLWMRYDEITLQQKLEADTHHDRFCFHLALLHLWKQNGTTTLNANFTKVIAARPRAHLGLPH